MITWLIIAENTSGAASFGKSRLLWPVSGSGSGLTMTRRPMTKAGTSIDVAYRGIASVVQSAETKASSAKQLRFSGACGKSGEASRAKKTETAAAMARAVVDPKQVSPAREVEAEAPVPAAEAAAGPSRSFLAAWPPCPLPPPASPPAPAPPVSERPKSREALL